MKLLKSYSDLKELRKKILEQKDSKRLAISVCVSTGCKALGVQKVLEALNVELKKHGLKNKKPGPWRSPSMRGRGLKPFLDSGKAIYTGRPPCEGVD